MEETIIEMREPTPTFKTRRCRLLAVVIAAALTYAPFAAALGAWYLYGLFYGVALLALAYLLVGIVRAKLRNSSVPPAQQELSYSDREIAAWFVSRGLFCP